MPLIAETYGQNPNLYLSLTKTLDEVYDIWVVTLNDTMLSFFKIGIKQSRFNGSLVLYRCERKFR